MSIPKVDPNFNMEELHRLAAEFLAAGRAYWEAGQRAGIGGALIWVEDTEKGIVLFTRGDYRETLLYNIPMVGPVYSFGRAKGDEE